MKIIIVAVCFLAIAAAVPCFPPPNMKLRPETCCEFPKFPKEEEMAEECMKKYGAQTTRLMADKSPGPKRGSVGRQGHFGWNFFYGFRISFSAWPSACTTPRVTMTWTTR